jgi:hypothetical protein
MTKPLSVNHKAFGTRDAVIRYFREMLNRYLPGQRVSDEDAADLADLITRHPEVALKIGAGIDHFEVRRAPQMGGQCFWIIRTDETATDFSFMTCVRGKGKSISQEFREACRMAVQNDIARAKRQYFDEHQDSSGRVPCNLTERPLTMEEAHANHCEPMRFEVIVACFLASKACDEPNPAWVTESKDAQAITTFVDPNIRDEFRAYHKRLARLRWIATEENLSLGASGQLRHAKGTIRL